MAFREGVAPRMVVRGAFVALGAAALLGQVLILREMLVVFAGNELIIGVVFGLWLTGIALGAALGGRFAARLPDPGTWLVTLLIAVGPVLITQITLIRELRGILGAPMGALLPLTGLLAASPVVVMPLPILVGLMFPLACRVAREIIGEDVTAAGSVYALEATGSLAAGLVFSFLLAGHLPAVSTGALAGTVAAAGALALAVARRSGLIVRLVALLILIASVVTTATPLGRELDRLSVTRRWARLAPGRQLLASVETRYGVLEIGVREGQYDLFGSGNYLTSFPDPGSSGLPAHLALCAHPDPRRVLVVGGGTGGLLQAMLSHPHILRLTQAEMDPGIASLVRGHLREDLARGLDDPRLSLPGIDGRRAVIRSDGDLDLVLVNVPEPTSALLNRFYTREFFEEVRSALGTGGVIAVRVDGLRAYGGGEVASLQAVLWRTLCAVFSERRVLCSDEETLFLGSAFPDVLTNDPGELGRRYASQGVRDPAFFPPDLDPSSVFRGVVFPRRAEESRRALEEIEGPVNLDGHPVGILHALVLFDRFSDGGAADFLRGLADRSSGVPLVVIGIPAILFVLLIGLLRREAGTAVAAHGAIAATGFAAMGLEMALLLQLQSSYGHVYGLVGVVIAVFMVGLAIGGTVSARWIVRGNRSAIWSLTGLVALTAGLCAVSPAMLTAAGGLPEELGLTAFLGLAAVIGLMTGLQFPCAVTVVIRHARTRMAAAAGGLDAADHAGAAVGSLIVGVVLLPLVGVAGACRIAATLSLVSGVGLLVAGFRGRRKRC